MFVEVHIAGSYCIIHFEPLYIYQNIDCELHQSVDCQYLKLTFYVYTVHNLYLRRGGS